MSFIQLPRPATGGGTPAGPSGSLQVADGSGNLVNDTQLKWDTTDHKFNLNGLAISALSSTISLSDGVGSPATIITWNVADYKRVIIEYSITRNSEEQIGQMMVVNTSTVAKLTDDFVVANEIGDLGIKFEASASAGTVSITYTSTATGFNGFMKFSSRQW